MAERKPQFKPIEKALIENSAILKTSDDLTEEIKQRGFKVSESDILGSIWSLIRRGELNFDEMRKIQASANHPHRLYLLPREQ